MKCLSCPFECRVDRSSQLGICRAPAEFKIATVMAHFWEEPCISGARGSGTVFFSHCNASCLFCQNYKISQLDSGKTYSDTEFLSLCEDLVKTSKVHNINLVSPTHYTARLLRVLPILKERIAVPIVWNSNGYEKYDLVEQLAGLVDVFLPDFKYFSDELALRYSKLPRYFEYASRAITAMHRICGAPVFDEEGIMQRGLVIRHLVLPGQTGDSKKVLSWIAENIGTEAYISLMSQYYPVHRAGNHPELNRTLHREEYQEVEDFCVALGFENGFLQGLDSNSPDYTPEF
ncbi:MAG: radical SAM protein [Pseudomonadota bacterium]